MVPAKSTGTGPEPEFRLGPSQDTVFGKPVFGDFTVIRLVFKAYNLENLILRYELKGKARTRPDILRVFWVHVHNVAHVRPRSKNGAKHQNQLLRR